MLLAWLRELVEGADTETLLATFETFTPQAILAHLNACSLPQIHQILDLTSQTIVERFFDSLYRLPKSSADVMSGLVCLRGLQGLLYGTLLARQSAGSFTPAQLQQLHRYIQHLEVTATDDATHLNDAFARAWLQLIPRPGMPAPSPTLVPERSLYIAAGDGKRGAIIGRLVLKMVPGRGAIYADPLVMALAPLSQRFQHALQTAWKHCLACGLALPPETDIVWRIEGIPLRGFQGNSLGAAFALVLRLFLLGEFIDDGVLITASVSDDPQGMTGRVDMVREKTTAALSLQARFPIRRILIHPDNQEEAKQAAFQAGADPEEVVYPIRSITDGIAFASHLDDWFHKREKHLVRELAQHRIGRVFATDEELNAFCILPQLYLERFDSGGAVGTIAPLEWTDIRSRHRSLLVTGATGTGKTILLWHEVLSPSPEIRMAFYVPAGDLARELFAQTISGSTPTAGSHSGSGISVSEETRWLLDTVVNTLLRRHPHGSTPFLKPWFEKRIRSGECLIAIDALNEVPATVRSELLRLIARFLTSSEGKQARILLTSQPEDPLIRENLAPTGILSYRLHDFSLERMRSLVGGWLSQQPHAAQSLWANIARYETIAGYRSANAEGNAGSILSLLRIPLYLRLVCEIAHDEATTNFDAVLERRHILLERFLQHLLSRWARLRPVPTVTERMVMADFASDVAYYLYCRQAARNQELLAQLRASLRDSLEVLTTLGTKVTDVLSPQAGVLPRLQSLLTQLSGPRAETLVVSPTIKAELMKLRQAIDGVIEGDTIVLPSQTEWPLFTVQHAVHVIASDERYREIRQRNLFQDLIQLKLLTSTGIGTSEEIFGFTHQALAEYLCARSLVARAQRKGWQEIADEAIALSGNTEFKEIIILMAGRFRDPTPLLRALYDRRRDDETRSRLALAAECFREIAIDG